MNASPIRPITEQDLDQVVALMADSFPRRDRAYFAQGLERLAARDVPEGTETWGYLIDDDGPKGAALSISSWHGPPDRQELLINISTWCVAPSHRGPVAKELYDRAGTHPQAIVTNLSAAKHTLKTLDRLGFAPWTTGQFLAIGPRRRTARAGVMTRADAFSALPDHQQAMFAAHRDDRFLRIVLDCDGRQLPLLLLRRKIKGVFPIVQLIYCEDTALLLAHSGPLFAWLRRRGIFCVIFDANGQMDTLAGRFFPGRAAKYTRGGRPSCDVDHTYSEMLYLGF